MTTLCYINLCYIPELLIWMFQIILTHFWPMFPFYTPKMGTLARNRLMERPTWVKVVRVKNKELHVI